MGRCPCNNFPELFLQTEKGVTALIHFKQKHSNEQMQVNN